MNGPNERLFHNSLDSKLLKVINDDLIGFIKCRLFKGHWKSLKQFVCIQDAFG